MTSPHRLLGLLVTLLLVGCSVGSDAPQVDVAAAPPADPPGRDAHLVEGGWPELAAMIRAENDAGRPVVVNLFASWCEPCIEEAPLLRRTAETHPEVAFIGVAYRDLLERSERFLEEHPLGFPTLWNFDGEVAEALDARGMPTTAFFGADGRLRRLHTGIVDEGLLAEAIAEIVPEG